MGRNSHAGAALYATLRQKGRITLAAEDAGKISNLRILAKRDGLRVVAGREPNRRMSRQQARHRPYEVCLTTDGIHITAPDASTQNGV